MQDNDNILQSILNTFAIWNETMDLLSEMEIGFGGVIGNNLNQQMPISMMDSICFCLNGEIEDKNETIEEGQESVLVRYYKFNDGLSPFRLDDAVRIVIENINSSDSASECIDKIKKIFV